MRVTLKIRNFENFVCIYLLGLLEFLRKVRILSTHSLKAYSREGNKIFKAKLNKNEWNIYKHSGKHWWNWSNNHANHLYYKITWYYRVTLHFLDFHQKIFPKFLPPFINPPFITFARVRDKNWHEYHM